MATYFASKIDKNTSRRLACYIYYKVLGLAVNNPNPPPYVTRSVSVAPGTVRITIGPSRAFPGRRGRLGALPPRAYINVCSILSSSQSTGRIVGDDTGDSARAPVDTGWRSCRGGSSTAASPPLAASKLQPPPTAAEVLKNDHVKIA